MHVMCARCLEKMCSQLKRTNQIHGVQYAATRIAISVWLDGGQRASSCCRLFYLVPERQDKKNNASRNKTICTFNILEFGSCANMTMLNSAPFHSTQNYYNNYHTLLSFDTVVFAIANVSIEKRLLFIFGVLFFLLFTKLREFECDFLNVDCVFVTVFWLGSAECPLNSRWMDGWPFGKVRFFQVFIVIFSKIFGWDLYQKHR